MAIPLLEAVPAEIVPLALDVKAAPAALAVTSLPSTLFVVTLKVTAEAVPREDPVAANAKVLADSEAAKKESKLYAAKVAA